MSRLRALLAVGGVLLVALAAGPARAATLTPTITEIALGASSHPVGLEPGPEGGLWITQWSNAAIGRMTLAGVTTPFTLPTPDAQASAITLGPDGNMWAVESAGNKVARITPAGGVTEYPLPVGGSGAASIVAGPDGRVWFTERTGGRIGRITPGSSVVSEITLAGGSQPVGLDVGADGNVWVALSGANAVARVTPAGAVTAFPVLTPSAGPSAVAAGPDGNVWFVERAVGRIGRITPAGVVTEFPLPSGASGAPSAIAAGPDGALWFATTGANTVGRITVAGVVEEYPLTGPGADPGVIGLGPDGNMWLTESGRDAVARITTPPGIGTLAASVKGSSGIDVGVGIAVHGQQTTASVEYGPTTAYGSTTPLRVFNSAQTGPIAQSWSITGLAPGTTYHLRVVASNATGTMRGPDVVVTTAPGPTGPGGTPPARTPAGGGPAPSIFDSPLRTPSIANKAKAPPAAALVGSSVIRVVAGRAPMTVSCPATAVDGCRGTIVLRALASSAREKPTIRARARARALALASRCARGCRPLGQAKFTVKRGKRRSVVVRLSATGRSAVAGVARVKARATVTTVVDGRSTTVARTVTLRGR